MFRSRLLAGAAGILLLAGCSFDLGLGGSDEPQALVVGGESYATKVGASILAQGGRAADAAAAMYFALAVTDPADAGLGGGGVCLVYDPEKSASEEFVFLPKAASAGGFAVPANVAGFAALHEAYGVLPWAKIVTPAESYARTGFPVSHALAPRLAAAADAIRLDAALAHEFMDESGKVKRAGATTVDPALAATLSGLRSDGPEAFYSGKTAGAIAAYTATQGAGVTAAELKAVKVLRGAPHATRVGGNYVFLPSEKSGAGRHLRSLVDALSRARGKDGTPAAPAAEPAGDLGATGFAVTDAKGQSVACAVTMNGLFGAGRTVPGTGITLARAAGPAADYLSPVISSPDADGQAVLVGAGGGPRSARALAEALSRIADDKKLVAYKDVQHDSSVSDNANLIVCAGGLCTPLADAAAGALGLSVPMPGKK